MLWGRCHEGEGAPTYWPWVEAIRAYVEHESHEGLQDTLGPGASHIGTILPELKEKLRDLPSPPELDPDSARFRLWDAVRHFLERASRKEPILLVLDDLHSADRASLLLLEFVAHYLAKMHVLVLGTYREGELSRPLSETLGELARARLQTVALSGLSRPEVGQLLRNATGSQPTDELVRAVADRTEGNPFFVTEIASLLAQGRPGTPESVTAAISRRLSRLSETCNRALLAASVIGREFDLALLSRLVDGGDEYELLETLDEALKARLIERCPSGAERCRFRHALIREVLYESISPTRRARWHRRIAETLEKIHGTRREDHAPRLAHHFARAGSRASREKVVRYSRIAGEQALAAHAPEEARLQFERAWKVRRDRPLDAEGAAILAGLGWSRAATSVRWNRQEAWSTLRRAIEHYVEAGDVAPAVAAATHPSITPEGADDIAPVIQQVLGMVRPGSREEGRLLARLGAASYYETGDYELADEAFSRALSIADAKRDVALELRTLALATSVDHFHLRWKDLLSKCRRVINLARRADDPHSETYARYRAAYSLSHSGRADEARLEAEASLARAEELRDYGLLQDALYVNVALAQLSGDWRAARAHSDSGLALSPHHLPLLHARALLEYETGEPEEGAHYLERLLEAERLAGPYPLKDMFTATAIPQIARLTEGVSLYPARRAARSVLARASVIPIAVASTRIGRALTAEAIRDLRRCEEELEFLDSFSGLILVPMLLTDRLLGLLAHAVGRGHEARSHLENALEHCTSAGYRPELAWTCYGYANVLFESESLADRERAASLLEEAADTSSELGMQPLATLVASLRDRQRTGLERSATPAEENVFRREGEYWAVAYEGMAVRVKDLKGLRDIACLLNSRGREIHVADLIAATDPPPADSSAAVYAGMSGDQRAELGLRTSRGASGDLNTIDSRARSEYRARIAELRAELEDAERCNDAGRIANLKEELDFIAGELASAFGLGRRPRRAGHPAERARTAVTMRIRYAVSKIARVHPALGRHLRESIRTGTFCSYLPAEPIHWSL